VDPSGQATVAVPPPRGWLAGEFGVPVRAGPARAPSLPRRSYAEVAAPDTHPPYKQEPAIPVRLAPSHWHGTLVAPADFVSAVNAASSGSHIFTGVCAQLPEGTTGLVVPPDLTTTVLLLDGHACTLPTTALRAPALCMRGQTRTTNFAMCNLD